jgi:hypothetical protein
MGSGLPQFGFPRRFAIDLVTSGGGVCASEAISGDLAGPDETLLSYFTDFLFKNQ